MKKVLLKLMKDVSEKLNQQNKLKFQEIKSEKKNALKTYETCRVYENLPHCQSFLRRIRVCEISTI